MNNLETQASVHIKHRTDKQNDKAQNRNICMTLVVIDVTIALV